MKKINHLKKITACVAGSAMVFGTVFGEKLPVSAEGTTNTVSYKCIMMNVPYTDLYAAYGLTDKAVWNVNKIDTWNNTAAGVLDAVSTATTKNFYDTTGAARGTYHDGRYILGVKLPVAVSEADYRQLRTGLGSMQDYYFEDLKEVPVAYSTLTLANGKYNFSKLPDAKVDISKLSVTDLETEGKYGDYQVSLNGVGTNGRLVTGENYTIYGAVLGIDDKRYGLTCLENLWYGTNVEDVQVAWSVVKGNQKLNVGGKLYYQFDHNGGELKSVQLLTNLGLIDIPCEASLLSYYPGSTAGIRLTPENGSNVLKVSGLPASLKNPKVSVFYEENSRKVILADQTRVREGQVFLKDKIKAGISYQVEISSDNYVSIEKTVSTSVTYEQREKLRGLVEKAKSSVNYNYDTELQKAVLEAERFLLDTNVASADVEELSNTLLKGIKKTYPMLNIDALVLRDSDLVIGLREGLSAIGKAQYMLTYVSGNEVKVLESGDLTGLMIKLNHEPVAGAEYTLTIVSENYQDTSKRVIAESTKSTPAPTATAAPTVTPAPTVKPTETASPVTTPAPTVKPVATSTPEPKASETPSASPEPQKAVIKVKTTSKACSASKLKKKAITFSIGASVNSGGKLSFSKISGSKKLSVNAETGKITVNKKTGAGIYTIKVKIMAAANGAFKSAQTTKMIVVNVD